MDRDYEIKPVKTQKDQVTHPALAEAGEIPKLMTSNIIVGKSGSGKTVLLHNLMTRKEFYADAFDRIILITPTGETDDIQKALEIKPSLVFTDLVEAVKVLEKIQEVQEKAIKEKGVAGSPKLCIIMDDCAGENKFMSHKAFTNLFIKARHFNVTVWFLTQVFFRTQNKNNSHLFFLAFQALAEDMQATSQYAVLLRHLERGSRNIGG